MINFEIENNWTDVMQKLYETGVPDGYRLEPQNNTRTAEDSLISQVQIFGGYQRLVSIVDFVAGQRNLNEPIGNVVKGKVAENEPAIQALMPVLQRLGIPQITIDRIVTDTRRA